MDVPQQPPIYRIPLAIGGTVVLVLILIGLFFTVTTEQRYRAEEKSISLASPSPLTQQSPTPTPTPRPTYQPQVPGLPKQRAVEIFLSLMKLSNTQEEQRLLRWDRAEIPVVLRGQPQASDSQCLTDIVGQLNPVMESSQLKLAEARRSLLDIYILPKPQFSSVYVDSPPDREAFIVNYTDDSATEFSRVEMLVNAEKPAEERCWYMRLHTLKALGLLDLGVASVPPSFIGEQVPPLGSRYSPYDLEMVRILYSSLLTGGLTQTEVERRLLQE